MPIGLIRHLEVNISTYLKIHILTNSKIFYSIVGEQNILVLSSSTYLGHFKICKLQFRNRITFVDV